MEKESLWNVTGTGIDKWHTEETLRNDLDRQAVLERLGFVFVRIRGSDYYRRKEKTVSDLYRRLDKLNAAKGIQPETVKSGEEAKIDEELLRNAEKFRIKMNSKIEEEEGACCPKHSGKKEHF